jgi:hypothetical protein
VKVEFAENSAFVSLLFVYAPASQQHFGDIQAS